MIIRAAQEQDLPGFLALAGQVEHWFGPMVDDPGFSRAVADGIRASTALVAASPDGPGLLGALLFGSTAPAAGDTAPVHHVHWLVVSEQARGQGVGRALMADAIRGFVHGPATIEVVTFGPDHPGAVTSGARAFYASLGFTPAEAADPGPEGGSRQVYRRYVS
ncbi:MULTISPECIES: GNAT family N-acetyltransferase [Streptomyces]|uniref:GNAT family N-acetyltransferase n=1 Tax=Streptomyces TaxID=1883 RepID=UPI0004BD5C61|nr:MULTISPECIES: GNAT family N-acetyltransferase [Streptomyces]MBG7700998.1 GNAT family N-acetyltransferase [Streptomyces sp. MC1]